MLSSSSNTPSLSEHLFQAIFDKNLETLYSIMNNEECIKNDLINTARDAENLAPLHLAAKLGFIPIIEALVNQGAKLNAPALENGSMPIHLAAKNGHLDVVQWLVKNADCNPNMRSNNGETPLHFACSDGKLNVVEWLIKDANADPNIPSISGLTALHCAVSNRHLKIVQYLIKDAKVDLLSPDATGYTTVLRAVSKGFTDIVQWLVQNAVIDPNIPNNNNETPLSLAIDLGHLEIVQVLVKNKKYYTPKQQYNGKTALFYAAMKGRLDIVQWLINEKHIEANTTNIGGSYALHWAASEGHINVMEWLIKHANVNPNAKNNQDLTSLHLAARYGQLNVVQWLVEKVNLNPNTLDKMGRTPLHRAAEDGHLNVVQWLVEKANVNPNALDKFDDTILHMAAEHGHLHVVQWLVEQAKVNPNAVDKLGCTSLHKAAERDHLKVVRYLVSHGVTISNYQNRLYIKNREFYTGYFENLCYLIDFCENKINYSAENLAKFSRILLEQDFSELQIRNRERRTLLELARSSIDNNNNYKNRIIFLLSYKEILDSIKLVFSTELMSAENKQNEYILNIIKQINMLKPQEADSDLMENLYKLFTKKLKNLIMEVASPKENLTDPLSSYDERSKIIQLLNNITKISTNLPILQEVNLELAEHYLGQGNRLKGLEYALKAGDNPDAIRLSRSIFCGLSSDTINPLNAEGLIKVFHALPSYTAPLNEPTKLEMQQIQENLEAVLFVNTKEALQQRKAILYGAGDHSTKADPLDPNVLITAFDEFYPKKQTKLATTLEVIERQPSQPGLLTGMLHAHKEKSRGNSTEDLSKLSPSSKSKKPGF